MTDAPVATLSQTLRDLVTEAAARWVDLPLLSGVRAGTLDPAIFRNYLEQDFLYLRYYARIYARLAASSATDDELEHFIALANGVIAVELDHHKSAAAPFGCDFDDIRVSAQLRAYLDFYDELAHDRAATLVAMLPCIYGYGVALERIRESAADGPYRAWIDIYTGADYFVLMERHFAMVDAADISTERALEIARRGLDLEVAFWNQQPDASEVRA